LLHFDRISSTPFHSLGWRAVVLLHEAARPQAGTVGRRQMPQEAVGVGPAAGLEGIKGSLVVAPLLFLQRPGLDVGRQ
jgi:hypothetical protein